MIREVWYNVFICCKNYLKIEAWDLSSKECVDQKCLIPVPNRSKSERISRSDIFTRHLLIERYFRNLKRFTCNAVKTHK